MQEFEVTRKLQEQSGSYFVILPAIWVRSLGLKEGNILSLKFSGNSLKIEPLDSASKNEGVQK